MKQRFPEAPRPTFIEEGDLFEESNWRDDAKCRGISPDEADRLFFSDELRGEAGRIAVQEAKRNYCIPCPAAADCLLFAMRANESHGIWGGLTTEERRELKKPVPRQAKAA